MKLSIIVPVYNAEPYLRRCIDSILAQTFTDFELILVDDGSPDNCPAICDEYAEKDPRIVVIHKDNGGISDARNAGLDIAKGDYIGFVDSDDYIDAEMYEKMYNAAIMHDSDIVSCTYERIDISRGKRSVSISISDNILTSGNNILEDYYSKTKWLIFTAVWNKIFKKELFDNIRFPKGKIYEDEYITPDLYSICGNTYIMKDPFYKYVCNEGSILTSNFSAKRLDLLDMAVKNLEFFSQHEEYGQTNKSEDYYVTYFLADSFAICNRNKQYKRDYKPYKSAFIKRLKSIFKNPEICRMKKATVLITLILPSLGEKLAKKYFPECVLYK
jgi:glycosyltransferase involved in cell wall biosynthesis